MPGATGANGQNGTNGSNGETGAPGPPGEAGPQGAPGITTGFPTGSVIAFAGSATALPTGWALCDGSAVSRTSATYAGLFAVIGTVHGSGDGTTTYNLPDYRGRFLRGTDRGAGHDPDADQRTAPTTGASTHFSSRIRSLHSTPTHARA